VSPLTKPTDAEKSVEESVLLDLKQLPMETKQRIPPVLASFNGRASDDIDAELDAQACMVAPVCCLS
jgi:hypothetical protein